MAYLKGRLTDMDNQQKGAEGLLFNPGLMDQTKTLQLL